LGASDPDASVLALLSGLCVSTASDSSLTLQRLADADFSERLKVDNGDGITEEGLYERQGTLQKTSPCRVRGGEEEGAEVLVLSLRVAKQTSAVTCDDVAGQELRRNERRRSCSHVRRHEQTASAC